MGSQIAKVIKSVLKVFFNILRYAVVTYSFGGSKYNRPTLKVYTIDTVLNLILRMEKK